MRFRRESFLSILFILFLVAFANGQEQTQDDGDSIADPAPVTAFLHISVRSSKKGYLKKLTYKDFEVYDDKELQEIEFFAFDETKNQYILGCHKEDFTDNKWHNVKVKIKLSKEKRKNFGKISVMAQKGYYSVNPNSKI